MSRVSLFCLPYSGSSATLYYKWRPHLRAGIELRPLELAGRGVRHQEPLYDTVAEAVADLERQLSTVYRGGPYAVFGHSLGGLLGFELARLLVRQGREEPVHLFFSGCRPPQHRLKGDVLHLKPDDQFLHSIFELGGTPAVLMRDSQLSRLFLPIIKSDYRLYETYVYEAGKPFTCPISVLVGDADPITEGTDPGAWSVHTTCEVRYQVLATAAHIFIEERLTEVLQYVNSILAPA